MTQTPSRDSVGGMLFDILSVGMERRTSQSLVPLLDFLRAVRPKAIDIVIILAWELLKDQRFSDARSLLETAEFERPDHAGIKATLASVLYFTNDPSWRGYVTEVRRLSYDEEAVIIVEALEAAADAGLEPATSFAAFQSRARLVEVITLNHPELITA